MHRNSLAKYFAHQVLQAVGFLDSKLIAHRDVKPANVLVDQRGTLKLIDFGACVEGSPGILHMPPVWQAHLVTVRQKYYRMKHMA
eukprot:2854-Heterococcus_DN1.PRE.2